MCAGELEKLIKRLNQLMNEVRKGRGHEVLYEFFAKVDGKRFSFYAGQGKPGRLRDYPTWHRGPGHVWVLRLDCAEGEKLYMWNLLHKHRATIYFRYIVTGPSQSKPAETAILRSLDFIGNKDENGDYRWADFFREELGWTDHLLNPETRKILRPRCEDQED